MGKEPICPIFFGLEIGSISLSFLKSCFGFSGPLRAASTVQFVPVISVVDLYSCQQPRMVRLYGCDRLLGCQEILR